MSYEILLYPRRPGQDWSEVLAEDEEETSQEVLEDEAALAEGVAVFGRVEDRLRRVVDDPVETWVAEEVGGDVFGELVVPTTGLQVDLFHGAAAVRFPVGPQAEAGTDDGERPELSPGADSGVGRVTGRDAEALHEQVRQAVAVVAEETGYEAYDPQTGQSFSGTFAVDTGGEALEPSAVLDADGSEGAAERSGTAAASRTDPRQDPAFLRRRSRLYIILGVLLLAYGLWRLAVGDSGWIAIFALGIGIIDLLGGLLFRGMAKGLEAQRESQV